MRDYPVKPVPFTAVRFHDEFWAPRLEINRAVTIPFAFDKNETTGRVGSFERAAAVLRGEEIENTEGTAYPFDDTDIYKVIEGAAYSLHVHPDPQLDAYIDGLIAKIAAAQEPDGYLYTTRTINPAHPHEWAGPERWVKEEDLSHELYNLGHLYEAAVAHFQATGKRALLSVALRAAEMLDATFGPGKKSVWPGHQVVEMGLVKLYRVTDDRRWLDLAKFFLDQRDGGSIYAQAHKPVVQQEEAVGHAVRAAYMYSGMADVAALAGDSSYLDAIDRLWQNVAEKKLYVTGGIGAKHEGEAFGGNYELPNLSAYNETCAAISNVYWNHRLFLLHADAQYFDVLERTLFNGLIAGVSLDGQAFFYPNPLESDGQHERSPWFGCACCPSNVTRFMASVPGYVYAQQGNALYVNLFVQSTADIEMDNGCTIRLEQETRYPWSGAVKMTLTPDAAGRFALHVRVPGWAHNEAVPSDLYRFETESDEMATLKVNGETLPPTLHQGYLTIDREWQGGDVVEILLPMPVRRIVANDLVEADRGRVALQRGPLVYCAEWPDNPEGSVRTLVLPSEAQLTSEFRPDLLNGVEVIQGRALQLTDSALSSVVGQEQDFTAIPYYAWANRGRGEMIVWLLASEAAPAARCIKDEPSAA